MLDFDSVEQGCPTFFLGGPHSHLGHRRRATHQWRSQRRIFKGSKGGCERGGQTKEYGPWMATMELTRGRGIFPTVMARAELPSDMKLETEMDVRVWPPGKNFDLEF